MLISPVESMAADNSNPVVDWSAYADNLPTGASHFTFGIATHPWWLDMHLDTFIYNFKQLKTGLIRLPVEWKTIEPEPGKYDWSLNDRLLDRLNDEGFEVVAEFVTIPPWASANPAECAKSDIACAFNPDNLNHFRQTVAEIAKRYPFIRYWEFWNEPEQWPNAGRDVCQYGRWLRAFYQSIKQVDPTMLVAATTLAGPDYLKTLYYCIDLEDGPDKRAYPWDAVGYHPYNLDRELSPSTGQVAPIDRSRIENMHQIMIQYGEGNKPIWITEIGFQSDPVNQAGMLREAFDWFKSKSYISMVILHMLHDWSEEFYGLMSTTPETYQYKGDITPQTRFTPKQPFYDAYKNYPKRDLPPAPASTSNMLVFPQSGHTVRGIFKKAWETRGGLELFGYPKTGQFYERNAADGHYYLVQYFERVRMEYHPEKRGTPYEVEFGLLGNELLVEKGIFNPAGLPLTQAAQPEKTLRNSLTNRYFSETGHNVSGLFLETWQKQGGLSIVGYPRTAVFDEPGEDGVIRKVQYFERARMELHIAPDGRQFVLFGLLSDQRLFTQGRLDQNNQPVQTDYYNPANFEFQM
ncbi:MAG TPA: beta-galactosidase [Chloroflexia bacterium]|nr:beta-galactosidase [Chloroflexia bacterium]